MTAPSRAAKHPDMQTVREVVEVLARHNPEWSPTTLTIAGKVTATVSAIAARLTKVEQRRLARNEARLMQAVQDAVSSLVDDDRQPQPQGVAVARPVEVSRGSGIGVPLDLEEGRRRLAAATRPVRLEAWAGPVAGPAELEKAFGTKRSTLHDWQRRGAVIGLLKGERKHVFPLAQFIDGRPVEGMAQVTAVIGNPRSAWQWLVEPKPSIGGTPLDLLKEGRVADVVAAAQRDFG